MHSDISYVQLASKHLLVQFATPEIVIAHRLRD